MRSPLRHRLGPAATLALLATAFLGSSFPAAAQGPVIWGATCPSHDLAQPVPTLTAPMQIELVELSRTSTETRYRLLTSTSARCLLAVNRLAGTQPVMADVDWKMVLKEENDPQGTREYSDLCAGRTVSNITGKVLVHADTGPNPGDFFDVGIDINGTGADLVVMMELQTAQFFLRAHGVFQQVGDHDCDALADGGSDSPRWEGAFVVWDPAFDDSDDGPQPPPLPDFPGAPGLDLSPVAELRSRLP